MTKFTEAKLEEAIISLLEKQGYSHLLGEAIVRSSSQVLIKDDLSSYLRDRYKNDALTAGEIERIIMRLEGYSSADLYGSNKAIMKMVADGFFLKRDDAKKRDLYIQLLDYGHLAEHRIPSSDEVETIGEPASYRGSSNICRVVSQLEITGDSEKRIPDAILYINGLPLVVFEFKSVIREKATILKAYTQLTERYKRAIPELFKYNAFCVISDGVNTRAGSFFASYEYYYSWRRGGANDLAEKDGIESLYTMISGLFEKRTLLDVIRNFVYFPDKSNEEKKILCRYPQYYAAIKLYQNIRRNLKPEGSGKGGTYFGATGSGKSLTMLFLTRLLMKSIEFSSPTIVLITDRTDLDDQLSRTFTNAKKYIGDENVISVTSRDNLRECLQGRNSGGVFLTTIQKFTEDTELLTDRCNVICISDEAHRSQVNMDQKVRVTENGVKRSYGFAKYLHESLPNATYVGFTGTPIDATLDVFGDVVDSYTMAESVEDRITVPIVYEGRAAKIVLDNSKLEDIENYYAQCADEGASEYQIEESKRAVSSMAVILGDPDRLKALAEDFVAHYEKRCEEEATVRGKALFVSSSRQIAWDFYKEVIALRPQWAVPESPDDIDVKPLERIKMIMTRGKDDPAELYEMLGNNDYRKELDTQFKNPDSNFRIAIVVDMWLTGFDVPFLDTMYIDKPVQRHTLIQTISRVNRTFEGKTKGLVVDYIGIKRQMNLALKHFSKVDSSNFEEISQSIIVVKDHIDLLNKLFHRFDSTLYFSGTSLEQLDCLKNASEYVQLTHEIEKRFMYLVRRLKAAWDICCSSEEFTDGQRETVHFYLAVRSILVKLNTGTAPDAAKMNGRVREMVKEALLSDGVEEIFSLGEDTANEIDLFSDEYLERVEKIKLPNTKIKLLQQLLQRAIDDFKKVNRVQGIDFSQRFKSLVEKYNERRENSTFRGEVVDDIINEMVSFIQEVRDERGAGNALGIDFEEKAFYDILKRLTFKYDFSYPEDKLLYLAREVKTIVDAVAKYPDWSQREDIKAELRVDLIILLAENDYPPVDRDEVYKEIFAQAENFKKYQTSTAS